MTAHVLVVNKETFPIHLQYMFIGTGAGQDAHENIGMISDISGIKEGDEILFYVEGFGFFGVFKAKTEVFWDVDGKYLVEQHKRLTNRLLIEPLEVYSKGISEWDALDNLDNLPEGNKSSVNFLIWSLIYRKLEAKRGCTAIFDYEYKQLLNLIKKENKNDGLKNVINYNFIEGKIIELDDPSIHYNSQKTLSKGIPLMDSINNISMDVEKKISLVIERKFKYIQNLKSGGTRQCTQGKCEAELEYFFIKNVGEERVNKITGGKKDLMFWGSQVFCGFGKRRIDILTISKENEIRIIELKDVGFLNDQLEQIKRYILWAVQYMREPEEKVIQPILVLKESDIDFEAVIEFNEEVKKMEDRSKNLKIFKWKIEEDQIKFEEVIY